MTALARGIKSGATWLEAGARLTRAAAALKDSQNARVKEEHLDKCVEAIQDLSVWLGRDWRSFHAAAIAVQDLREGIETNILGTRLSVWHCVSTEYGQIRFFEDAEKIFEWSCRKRAAKAQEEELFDILLERETLHPWYKQSAADVLVNEDVLANIGIIRRRLLRDPMPVFAVSEGPVS